MVLNEGEEIKKVLRANLRQQVVLLDDVAKLSAVLTSPAEQACAAYGQIESKLQLWRQLLEENEQLMAKYSCHCLSTSKWTHLGRHRSASTPRWNSQ